MATMNTDWAHVGSGALQGAGTGASIGSIFGPAGAGIGAGAGALIGGISGYFESQSQLDAENRANEEYDRRFEQQNEEYNRRVADERAYNDPTAQAERLKGAGINPLSVMTQGGLSNTTTTAGNPSDPSVSTPYGVPRRSPLSPSEVLSSVSLAEDVEAKRLDNEQRRINLRLGEIGISQELANLIGIQLANRIAKVNAEVQEATKGNQIRMSDETLRNLINTNDKIIIEVSNLVKDGKLKDKDLDVMDSQIALNASSIARNFAEKELADATAKNYADRLAFDREVEQRIKNQGLQGLRLQSAELGLEKEKFDWQQTAKEIDQELTAEGINIDWANLAPTVVSAIAWALTMYFSKSGATAKGAATVVRKIFVGAGKFK